MNTETANRNHANRPTRRDYAEPVTLRCYRPAPAIAFATTNSVTLAQAYQMRRDITRLQRAEYYARADAAPSLAWRVRTVAWLVAAAISPWAAIAIAHAVR